MKHESREMKAAAGTAEVMKSASLCILTGWDHLLSSISPFVKLLQPLHL